MYDFLFKKLEESGKGAAKSNFDGCFCTVTVIYLTDRIYDPFG